MHVQQPVNTHRNEAAAKEPAAMQSNTVSKQQETMNAMKPYPRRQMPPIVTNVSTPRRYTTFVSPRCPQNWHVWSCGLAKRYEQRNNNSVTLHTCHAN